MNTKFPLEKKDLELEDNHDEPRALGGSYNEEMSRAAVGLLFDSDDDDSSDDADEPVSYVSGFERNPTSRRPKREAETRDEQPPRSRAAAPTEPPEERSRTRSRSATTRIMEGGEPEPREPRDARPPRDRERSRAPERDRGRERPPERGSERGREREHILERERPQEPDRERGRERGERAERGEREPGRDRGRRPDGKTGPVPAVRTNVKKERPPEGRGRREPRHVPAPIEDGYDNFRQRYNPDELISSPRSSGKQGRRGQSSGGRGGFAAAGYGGNPNIMRWVALGSAGVFILLMIVLIFQVSSLAGQRNYYREIAENMENETFTPGPSQLEMNAMEETIDILNNTIANLRNSMIQAGLDPDAPVLPPNFGGQPSVGGELPPQATEPASAFPMQITVNSGDSLSRIANRYYGSNTAEIIAMIANYNGLRNPNDIQIGQTLTLPPLP